MLYFSLYGCSTMHEIVIEFVIEDMTEIGIMLLHYG